MAGTKAIESICANCLSKLRINTSLPPARIYQTRPFHNTPLNQASKPSNVRTGVQLPGLRQKRGAKIKKKGRERATPPAVGERKAMRKRIVLSNTNALAVLDMQDLSSENMGDGQLQSQVLGLSTELIDQLRAVEAFKTSQNWSMFRRPGTLIRKETTEIAGMLKEVNEAGEVSSRVIRSILDGPKLGGKSLMLVQAMSMAFLNNWVVVNIPETKDVTNAHSSYRPLQTAPDGVQLYAQADMTAALLQRIARSNEKVLSKLTLAHEHPNFPVPLQSNLSLERLADRGASNPSEAPAVFSALWKELTVPAPKHPRPPIMISVDGLNCLMADTAYRAADFSLIHAHQFNLIKHFLSLIFGKEDVKLGPAGGVVLAAMSGSNSPGNFTLDISMKQLAARTATPPIPADSPDFPLPDPYVKLDKRILDLFSNSEGLRLQKIHGLSKAEAKGMLEYFARSGLLRAKITDELVAEKWSLSAGGVIGFVERAAARVRA